MKSNHEENIEKYYQDQDRKIRFKVVLYLVILVSLCCIAVFDKYRELKKSKSRENKTLQNSEFSGK